MPGDEPYSLEIKQFRKRKGELHIIERDLAPTTDTAFIKEVVLSRQVRCARNRQTL